MKKSLLYEFRYPLVSSLLIFGAVWWYAHSMALVWVALLLAFLEVALSFDNAVLNARVLRNMDHVWQKRFLLWGILIAVFGMRLVVPVMLVYGTSTMSFMQVVTIALTDSSRYGAEVSKSYPLIASFGAGFLIAVCMHFFGTPQERTWVRAIEQSVPLRLLRRTKRPSLWGGAVAVVIFAFVAHEAALAVVFALGVFVHELLGAASALASRTMATAGKGAQGGLIGFIYLEVLDASFSFDGVVGAFALSTDIFVIMAGLGIGALFVRSLTIYFVRQGVLEQLCYLEHGAHYAILSLAILLLVKIYHHVPEWLTGGLSIGVIVLAIIASRRHRSAS